MVNGRILARDIRQVRKYGHSGTNEEEGEDEEAARRKDGGMEVIGCFPSDAVQKACTTVMVEKDQGLLATWL